MQDTLYASFKNRLFKSMLIKPFLITCILVTCILVTCFLLAFHVINAHSAEAAQPKSSKQKTPLIYLDFKILRTQDHDRQLFTQGFIVDNQTLIESSGLYGKSFIRRYNIDSNVTILQKRLPANVFAEGITRLDDKIYLLTWKAQTLFIFDAKSFKTLNTHAYTGEGWGLTHNSHQFYMSNGSHHISIKDTRSFQTLKTISVNIHGKPQNNLNELEYAKNSLWANQWYTNNILRINPNTGDVTGKLVLDAFVSQLKKSHALKRDDVLNGIAYDKEADAFWITGKRWPKRYLIKIFEPAKPTEKTTVGR